MSDENQARQLVVFTLGTEQYALPNEQVHEIIRYDEPRSVASRIEWVRGVISLRGRIVPVYDLAAHAIYLPNGTVLEAHSGMGSLRDDLEHVSVPNLGATPPAVYSLKPREKDFHGVAAIRMTPTEGSDIFGRSGLLVHSYMLGPNGDSNGCISVREYDRFLKAFNDGQFSHIAVVTSVKAMILAQQNAD